MSGLAARGMLLLQAGAAGVARAGLLIHAPICMAVPSVHRPPLAGGSSLAAYADFTAAQAAAAAAGHPYAGGFRTGAPSWALSLPASAPRLHAWGRPSALCAARPSLTLPRRSTMLPDAAAWAPGGQQAKFSNGVVGAVLFIPLVIT